MAFSKRREKGPSWTNRLPEFCGIAWLALLAGAVWMHTHVTMQTPIYDAFTYYQKADYFWAAMHAGTAFNPLNIQPTFRPPGTILMSYPFGFSVNPRPFYFRSVYLPAFLLFAAVCIASYETGSDARARWRIILTGILVTTITLPYHFEYGCWGGFWGLVDSYFSGLAAVVAACVWRGTRQSANILAWAIATCLLSVLEIIVKPSGVWVAAVAGFAWIALGLAAWVEHHRSGRWQMKKGRALIFKLLFGAVVIAAGDALIVLASLKSGYLSPQNMAYGRGAIVLMKQQMQLPWSELWIVINGGLGRGIVYWFVLAVLICAIAAISAWRSVFAARYITAVLVCIGTILFGIWFWFIGSSSSTQIRYAVPFFMMALVWLIPVVQRSWDFSPWLLRRAAAVVMVAAGVNLAALLLVPRPSLNWQIFSGVGITADFPPVILSAFKRFVAAPAVQARTIYVVSMDTNDAILGSVIDEARLLFPKRPILSLRRPIDWQRSATIRINEVEAANALMVSPTQCVETLVDQPVANLADEQSMFTCWATRLTAADGVTPFLSTPTDEILSVVDPVKFQASLKKMVAAHRWDETFAIANHS